MWKSPSSRTDAMLNVQLIVDDRLRADCTLSEVNPGHWLALGSVRAAQDQRLVPATVVVGEGSTRAEALAQVKLAARREAMRPAEDTPSMVSN